MKHKPELPQSAGASYIRLARRLAPDSTPQEAARFAARLAKEDVLGKLWDACECLPRLYEIWQDKGVGERQIEIEMQRLREIINKCRQPEAQL